jgi:hypothetical protein
MFVTCLLILFWWPLLPGLLEPLLEEPTTISNRTGTCTLVSRTVLLLCLVDRNNVTWWMRVSRWEEGVFSYRLAYHPNECLDSQSRWSVLSVSPASVRQVSLLVTSYHDFQTRASERATAACAMRCSSLCRALRCLPCLAWSSARSGRRRHYLRIACCSFCLNTLATSNTNNNNVSSRGTL